MTIYLEDNSLWIPFLEWLQSLMIGSLLAAPVLIILGIAINIKSIKRKTENSLGMKIANIPLILAIYFMVSAAYYYISDLPHSWHVEVTSNGDILEYRYFEAMARISYIKSCLYTYLFALIWFLDVEFKTPPADTEQSPANQVDMEKK